MMRWTTEKPRLRGWYWVRLPGMLSARDQERIVHIYERQPGVWIVTDGDDQYRITDYPWRAWSTTPIEVPV